MKTFLKIGVLIFADLLLFGIILGMLLYAFFELSSVKSALIFDQIYYVILGIVILKSILDIVVSVFKFRKKKIFQGVFLVIYAPVKIYLIWILWIFFITVRAGGPPTDDYDVARKTTSSIIVE